MTTECNQFVFGFHPQKRREIRAQFDGGAITSDGGGLLLRDVEKRIGILRQFDGRKAILAQYPVCLNRGGTLWSSTTAIKE